MPAGVMFEDRPGMQGVGLSDPSVHAYRCIVALCTVE